jgi:hypothetical protein
MLMSEEAVALGDGKEHSAGSVEADQETSAPDPQGDDRVAPPDDEPSEPETPETPAVTLVAAPAESAADDLKGPLADESEQVPAAKVVTAEVVVPESTVSDPAVLDPATLTTGDDPAASVPIVPLGAPESEPQAADLADADAPDTDAPAAENATNSARKLLLSVLGVIVLLVVGVVVVCGTSG